MRVFSLLDILLSAMQRERVATQTQKRTSSSHVGFKSAPTDADELAKQCCWRFDSALSRHKKLFFAEKSVQKKSYWWSTITAHVCLVWLSSDKHTGHKVWFYELLLWEVPKFFTSWGAESIKRARKIHMRLAREAFSQVSQFFAGGTVE